MAPNSAATYTATRNGFYTVTVTYANGCTGTSPEFTLLTVGIPAVLPHNGIQVSPNPTKRIVYLSGKAAICVKTGE